MNCLYKWTNSTHEEEDQGSSWESEREGEKVEELGSLEAPDGEGDHLAEDDQDEQASGGLNHMVSRNAGKAHWTFKKSHRCCWLGGGRQRDAEEHVPRKTTEETERSKNGKEFKGPGGGKHIKNYGQQVMSVRTPEGFVRKST